MQLKELIGEIARRHNIILDESDPIFAIATANELILDSFRQELHQELLEHLLELESHKASVRKELNIAKNEINNAIEALQRQAASTKEHTAIEPALPAQNTEPKKLNFNLIWVVVFMQVVFLLIGFIIGKIS